MTQELAPPLAILIVEDDVLDEALVVATFKREGLAFVHQRVDNEKNFRQLLAQQPWDVVISDYSLPTFSAEDALDILKSCGLDIPCIVISGYIGEEAAVTLMKAGACDFVPKGNLARLVPAIRRELSEAHNRREKYAIEQSLRHQEKLLTGIAAALGEGLIVTDAAGNIIFINPEAERLLGWANHEVTGKNKHQLVHYCKEDGSPYAEANCPIMQHARLGQTYRSEDEIFVHKDGSCFHVAYVSTPIIEAGVISAVVTGFQNISRRKQAERDLTESRRQLRELSNFLQLVREKERTRIARELHDELGQALTALKIDVSWMLAKLAEDQDALLAKADSMLTLIDTTVDAMRRIAANLRPGLLDDLGLVAALEWLVEEFKQRTGVPYTLQLSHEEFAFDAEFSTAVFRIVQEAITNVARYARASHLLVLLKDDGEQITLIVKDNGIGFDMHNLGDERQTYGLLGIRERVSILGGECRIISQVGQGMELCIKLPKSPK